MLLLLCVSALGASWVPVQASAAQTPRAPLGSIPAADEEVHEVPPFARVVFGEPVQPLGPGLTVHSSTGERVDLGDADQGPSLAVVQVSLPATLEPGAYVARWQVAFGDATTAEGAWEFTVASTVGEGDTGLFELVGASGLALAVAAAVVAAGLTFLALRGRDDGPTAPPEAS